MSIKRPAFKATNLAVREKYENRCANCGVDESDATLNVHHIVPRSRGGSNLMSNQVLLCRPCRDAAHNERMAPTVQSMSTGSMDPKTFDLYCQFWRDILPAIGEIVNVPIKPVFIAEDRCWHIAEADMRMLMGMIHTQI